MKKMKIWLRIAFIVSTSFINIKLKKFEELLHKYRPRTFVLLFIMEYILSMFNFTNCSYVCQNLTWRSVIRKLKNQCCGIAQKLCGSGSTSSPTNILKFLNLKKYDSSKHFYFIFILKLCDFEPQKFLNSVYSILLLILNSPLMNIL
jgi:hypothetical protein